MGERVAIIGSREYPHRDRVENYVNALPDGTVIVSGGAPGVDRWAQYAASQRGLRVWLERADWDRYGRAAGPMRNALIVAGAERLVAFWDGSSRGTADTIRKARAAGIPVEVIGIEPEATP